MKVFLNLCCAASVLCLLAIASGNFTDLVPVKSEPKATHSAVNPSWGKPKAFNSLVESVVVQYFDTYRSETLGLPPGFAKQAELNEPFEASAIVPGMVLAESDRAKLIEAPQELERFLPGNSRSMRCFIAGQYFVAVDNDFKVLGAVWIPTIRQVAPIKIDYTLQLVQLDSSR